MWLRTPTHLLPWVRGLWLRSDQEAPPNSVLCQTLTAGSLSSAWPQVLSPQETWDTHCWRAQFQPHLMLLPAGPWPDSGPGSSSISLGLSLEPITCPQLCLPGSDLREWHPIIKDMARNGVIPAPSSAHLRVALLAQEGGCGGISRGRDHKEEDSLIKQHPKLW